MFPSRPAARRLAALSLVALLVMVPITAMGGPISKSEMDDRAVNDPDDPETPETIYGPGWWHHLWADSTRAPGDVAQFPGLSPTATYTLNVSGTWKHDGRTVWDPATLQRVDASLADAECSISLAEGAATWSPDRYDVPYANLLDVQMAEGAGYVAIDWIPDVPFTDPSKGSPKCSQDHRYHATVTVPDGSLGFAMWDVTPWNNAGGLVVTVTGEGPRWTRDYPCPKWAEEDHVEAPQGFVGEIRRAEILVDSYRDVTIREPWMAKGEIPPWAEAGHLGILTCNWLVAGHTYLLFANGSYVWDHTKHTAATPHDADAECSRHNSTTWAQFGFTGQIGPDGFDGMDLWIGMDYRGDQSPNWHAVSHHEPYSAPKPGHPPCDPGHSYWAVHSPGNSGPLNLDVADALYAEWDNRGTIRVTILRVG